MAVRRKRPRTRTAVSQKTVRIGPKVDGIRGSDDALAVRVGQAANAIADGIRSAAASFSKKIPPSVHVSQGQATNAVVFADSDNARPIELGLRHPLYGNRDHWYASKHVAFMEDGAEAAADKAAEALSKVVDDWAEELGYK